jgi:hypothetical protein
MTKAEIVELVKRYLECEETTFVANIDTFIRLAEEALCHSVQMPVMRGNATGALTASSALLAMPTGHLSTYWMNITVGGEKKFLISKDESFLNEAFPGSTTGEPRFFALQSSNTYLLAPAPDDNYSYEISYFRLPDSLADAGDSGSTWLSINAVNALVFGIVLQGYIYLKGDQDTVQLYQKMYEEALGGLKTIGEGRDNKDSYRVADSRVPV